MSKIVPKDTTQTQDRANSVINLVLLAQPNKHVSHAQVVRSYLVHLVFPIAQPANTIIAVFVQLAHQDALIVHQGKTALLVP